MAILSGATIAEPFPPSPRRYRGCVTIAAQDSAAFARLSGDFNPLHLDPIAARRTQFGGTVVHGIHLLLAALDAVAAQSGLDGLEPLGLRLSFAAPVNTAAPVFFDAHTTAERHSLKLVVKTGSAVAVNATIELASPMVADHVRDHVYRAAAPRHYVFPPGRVDGRTAVTLSRAGLARLFPALSARTSGTAWIADLLATTRIVGMRCPGLRSIYLACRLSRAAKRQSLRHKMDYRIARVDARFKLVTLAVAGSHFEGSVDALFRLSPFTQASSSDIAKSVEPNSFSGHNALIVGGSRGLGELTAKIIAAGGGEVTITYAAGNDDIERVAAQCRAVGARCTTAALDVRRESTDWPGWLTTQQFTHVYYFASPHIARNTAGSWNQQLYEGYLDIYVRAFRRIVEALQSTRARPLRFFYPSTTLLDKPERDFAEYCAAKAVGETLCDQLAHQFAVQIDRPRLPRMWTDQTLGLRASQVQDAFPPIHDVVRAMHR